MKLFLIEFNKAHKEMKEPLRKFTNHSDVDDIWRSKC